MKRGRKAAFDRMRVDDEKLHWLGLHRAGARGTGVPGGERRMTVAPVEERECDCETMILLNS
jgi:hypothetical protein